MVNQGDIVTFENVEIYNGTRNFDGLKFNDPSRKRSFGFFLEPEIAEAMARDGWVIKYTKPPKDKPLPPDWEPRPWLKVDVSFKFRPPTVVLITSRGRTVLDEEAFDILQEASMKMVDLSIRARFWTFDSNNTSGLKAMLHEMYVTIEESPLAMKYNAFDVHEYDEADDEE